MNAISEPAPTVPNPEKQAAIDAANAAVDRYRSQLAIERGKLASIDSRVSSAKASYPAGRPSRDAIGYGQLFLGAAAAKEFIQADIIPTIQARLSAAESHLAELRKDLSAEPAIAAGGH